MPGVKQTAEMPGCLIEVIPKPLYTDPMPQRARVRVTDGRFIVEVDVGRPSP